MASFLLPASGSSAWYRGKGDMLCQDQPLPPGCAGARNKAASLVVQWLRIRLPMQETQVRALVREDPTCHRATKPVRHNY